MRLKLNQQPVEALKPAEKPYEARDTDIHGFLLRVQPPSEKSPKGRKAWFYQYRRLNKDGKQRQTRIKLGDFPGLSAEGARQLAKKTAGKIANGDDPQARKKAEREQARRASLSTLRAFLDRRYEPWAIAHLKSAAFQLARLRSDFADDLDQPLHSFDSSMVESLRQRWKKSGAKNRSVNRDIQRLQSVLSRAVEWGVIDRHPLAGLKPLKFDKTGRVRFLTPDEEAALRGALSKREDKIRERRIRLNAWRAARGKEPLAERSGKYVDHLHPLVLLALNTGLRRGELLGLKWAAVNFEAKLLTVVAETAKSGHTRRVPLNTEAYIVLSTWHEAQSKPASDAFVFPGAEGERMKKIDTAWRGLTKAAGITNFRLHDCRHHFASRLVQAGVDLYTVKELLGHSEITMTERYSHLAPDNLRLAVEKVAG